MPYTGKRTPSFLAKTADDFTGLCYEHKILSETAHELWDFAKAKITESYWNGVENGATGKVKPKEKRA